MTKPLIICCAGHAGWRAAHHGAWNSPPEGVNLQWMKKSVRKTVENIKAADFVWANLTYGDDDFDLADVAMAARLGGTTFLTLPAGLNVDGMDLPKVDHIIRTGDSEEDFKVLLKVIEEWRAKTDEADEAVIANNEDEAAAIAKVEAKFASAKANAKALIAELEAALPAVFAETEANVAIAKAKLAELKATIAFVESNIATTKARISTDADEAVSSAVE